MRGLFWWVDGWVVSGMVGWWDVSGCVFLVKGLRLLKIGDHRNYVRRWEGNVRRLITSNGIYER